MIYSYVQASLCPYHRLMYIKHRMILVWLCAFQVALALPADDSPHLPSWPANDTDQRLVCSPFGVCEPCPGEAVSRFHVALGSLKIYPRSFNNPFASPLAIGVSCTASMPQPICQYLMSMRLRAQRHRHIPPHPIVSPHNIPKAKFSLGSHAAALSTKNAQTFTNLSHAIFYLPSLHCPCCSRGRSG
jgi:hypothetical protein